jgi:hypothetical protein
MMFAPRPVEHYLRMNSRHWQRVDVSFYEVYMIRQLPWWRRLFGWTS